MANRNSDMPAQPRDIDRRDSADDGMRGDDDGMRGDVESVRGVGDSDDEFEDTEDLDDHEEEGTF